MALSCLHWPPHGPTRCGKTGLERARRKQATTCRVCKRYGAQVCNAFSRTGFKCAGPKGHKGYHWSRWAPKWRGTHPEAREAKNKPAHIPKLSAETLKTWRLELGLTLKEAEHRVGVSRNGEMWGRWENKRARIPALLSYIALWLPELPDVSCAAGENSV